MEFNSISHFKRNFAAIFHKDVAPSLHNFEQERIATRKKAFIQAALWAAAGVLVFFASFWLQKFADVAGFIGIFLIVVGAGVYFTRQKSFETDLKFRLMPVLMKAFGNFEWTTQETINTSDIYNSRIFDRFTNRTSDDNFSGEYKNMPVNISETELYYYTTDSKGRRHKHTVFKGALVSIGVGKNFTGHTIVKTRHLLNSKNYQEVKLEDPEFTKKFFVDSNDQVEARFLLTTAFMERFKRISNAFGSQQPQCSFMNGRILIALATNKDLFKLGDLNTSLSDTKPFQVFLNEIISIMEMIEHLKVTEKTGL